MKCTCENCRHTQLDIETVTVDGHVAELCVTCAHVFRQNPQRLKVLVRGKSEDESNSEMQKQHQLLSRLITVGAVGLVAILGMGVADQLQGVAAIVPEYLSFAQLNQF